jgi:hypothetical protein
VVLWCLVGIVVRSIVTVAAYRDHDLLFPGHLHSCSLGYDIFTVHIQFAVTTSRPTDLLAWDTILSRLAGAGKGVTSTDVVLSYSETMFIPQR